ncbi:hypothetical protein QL285_037852 [Trifolium repens]|nr:hypothetical protein QL285_037852 [Trifolium repens]
MFSPFPKECVLRMDTSDGWENSMTKVLESFKDLRYEINPSYGFTYVKGKADPHQILSKLSKSGNHAKIEWISHGFPRVDQNQVQEQANGYYNNHLDPFYHNATYPYQHNIYQLNPPPYPNWHNFSQNALPYGNHHGEHQHNGHNMFGAGSISGRAFDCHCLVRSNCHHSDSRNRSPPFIRPETNNQANEQPTQPQPSGFLKKLVKKLKLCFKG